MIKTYTSTAKNPSLVEAKLFANNSVTICVAPTKAEIEILVSELKLEEDMLSDALDIYETPRIEQYEGATFFYTRYCRPQHIEISTEPITIVSTGKKLLVIFREKSSFSDRIVDKINCPTTHLTRLIYQIMAQINLTYRGYLLKISREVLSVRSKLNKHDLDNKDFINFIDMEEDLGEIMSTLQSYDQMLQSILRGKLIKMYDDDIDLAEDVELGIKELMGIAESRKTTIASTREAYSTIMANNLNKTFKKLTSISIFMTIPTITSGLYGMNLALPLAKNHLAFWYILAVVMSITGFVVWLFKKLKWL
jgi:magnesium transporter